MNVLKYIPNTITCLNLISGCMAIVAALNGDLRGTILWIIAASVFDFTDGLAARLLKAYSPLGKELDSLSDIVSFGVAPGMALFMLLKAAAGVIGLSGIAVLLLIWRLSYRCFLLCVWLSSILMSGKPSLSSECRFRLMHCCGARWPVRCSLMWPFMHLPFFMDVFCWRWPLRICWFLNFRCSP